MIELDGKPSGKQLAPANADEAVQCLRQAIAGGEHWYIALLKAIRVWTAAEENRGGRTYRYLIDGEAFDWLLLAERLCESVDGMLPEDERDALLFRGQVPLKLTIEVFKELIGSTKHCQLLNYFYGITVEESLLLVVLEEVRKEQRSSIGQGKIEPADEAYQRIYGETEEGLLRLFREEKRYPQANSISLTGMREFTYWRFKYRLRHCDKAKVASDTRKALIWLQSNGYPGCLTG